MPCLIRSVISRPIHRNGSTGPLMCVIVLKKSTSRSLSGTTLRSSANGCLRANIMPDCCRRFAACHRLCNRQPWAHAHGYRLPPLRGYQLRPAFATMSTRIATAAKRLEHVAAASACGLQRHPRTSREAATANSRRSIVTHNGNYCLIPIDAYATHSLRQTQCLIFETP